MITTNSVSWRCKVQDSSVLDNAARPVICEGCKVQDSSVLDNNAARPVICEGCKVQDSSVLDNNAARPVICEGWYFTNMQKTHDRNHFTKSGGLSS